MGSSSGLVGLKCLQWLFCGIEFCSSVVLLAIYSCFLATMLTHQISVSINVKAIEGFSALGTLYTGLGLLLICCCAGHPAPSFIFVVFTLGLAGSYIYVAIANRAGASSFTGSSVYSLYYGSGDASATPNNDSSGITGLPTYQRAC